MRYSPVRRSSASSKLDLLPLDLHVLGLPPAFNLSHDQTLQFTIIVMLTCRSKATKAHQTWLKGQTNSFFRPKPVDASLALIIGDLSPSSASAHMNYLIKFLKSVSLCNRPAALLLGLSDEGVFYAFRDVCQTLFSVTEFSASGEQNTALTH